MEFTEITIWNYLQGTAMLAGIMAASFIIFGALMGIFAWIQLSVSITTLKKRAKELDQARFLIYWQATGIELWKKLHK